MDAVYWLFRDKVYASGFLQRRQYRTVDGERTSGEAAEWERCYVEVQGPWLRCWRAGACDADPSSIARLKDQAIVTASTLFPLIDLRIVTLGKVKDFFIDRSTHNAFALNNTDGMDTIHLMTSKATQKLNWIKAIQLAHKESQIIDQRFTAHILTQPDTPIYVDSILPEHGKIMTRWDGGKEWQYVKLVLQARGGWIGRLSKTASIKSRCIYIYTSDGECLARLTDIKTVYMLAKSDTDIHMDIVVEASGKRKSEKLKGLKNTNYMWLRCESRQDWIRWTLVLRNVFEITTPKAILDTLDLQSCDEMAIYRPIVAEQPKSVTSSNDSSKISMKSSISQSQKLPIIVNGNNNRASMSTFNAFKKQLPVREFWKGEQSKNITKKGQVTKIPPKMHNSPQQVLHWPLPYHRHMYPTYNPYSVPAFPINCYSPPTQCLPYNLYPPPWEEWSI